jgi:hypothetical protein
MYMLSLQTVYWTAAAVGGCSVYVVNTGIY